MRMLHSLCTAFLLIALTCGVVLAPQRMSGQKQRDKLTQTYTRQYDSSKGPEITSEQVARSYYNHELNVGYYNASLQVIEGDDADRMREHLINMIELLLGENESVCHRFQIFLESGTIGYFKNDRLIKIDGQPIALSFVSCTVRVEERNFGILYEEKTNTIISFSCEGVEMTFDNAKEMDECLWKTEWSMRSYFKEYVGSLIGDCYFYVDFPSVLEKSENGIKTMLHAHCGLMQYSDKEVLPQNLVFF